ncbi:hypothetical protein AB0L65_54915 [Nonomuraea sp. NPDC052116]|uniref:hypothetical protein n=1 Tax=Nonomuraea sp. NPDC052116 TaxID=3155665 RepID=UPI00342B111B
MRVCFHGTSEEIALVAGRPMLILLTARDLPRLRVFEIFNPHVLRHPYQEHYRLCADLTETEVSDLA